MNVELRLLNEELSGAAIAIEAGKTYAAGGSFNFDIFIPNLDDRERRSEQDSYFEFRYDGDSIVFSKMSVPLEQIQVPSAQRKPLTTQVPLLAPALFQLQNVFFAICSPDDPNDQWTPYLKPPAPEKPAEEKAAEPTKEESSKTESFETATDEEMAAIQKMDLYDDSEETRRMQERLLSSKLIRFLSRFAWFRRFQEPLSKNLIPFEMKLRQGLSRMGKKTKLILISTLVLLLVVVGTCTAYKKWASHRPTQESMVATPSDVQFVKQVLNNLPNKYANLRLVTNTDGTLTIEGMVNDESDLQELKQKFAKMERPPTYKIYLSIEVLKKVQKILDTQNLKLVTAQYDEDKNRVYLSGLVDDMSVINDVELNISNQVPEAGDIDIAQVYAQGDVDKDLSFIENKNKLARRVTIARDWSIKTVTFTGYLSKEELANLKTDIYEFTQRYQNLIHVEIKIKDAFSSLPFKILQVTTGSPGMIVTEDGRKVFEGGVLDGMKVEKITPTEIVFSGKFALTLRLGSTGSLTEKK